MLDASMAKWIIPTLSEILQQHLSSSFALNLSATLAMARQRAEWAWSGAIASLGQLLQLQPAETDAPPSSQGVILCGPLPLFTDPDLLRPFSNWIFIPDLLANYWHNPPQLLPGSQEDGAFSPMPFLPLLPEDPLALEQFCLVLTPAFGLVLVIGDDRYGLPHFQFSFNAEILSQCCQVLLHRIDLTGSAQRDKLNETLQRFPLQDPDFRIVSEWTRLFLDRIHYPESGTGERGRGSERAPGVTESVAEVPPDALPPVSSFSAPLDRAEGGTRESTRSDVKLLQALAHEIRTPLATIRTLTRLLLKRQDLPAPVVQRLQSIDQECTEQIDRFGLIFRAAELESSVRDNLELAPTALGLVFTDNLPRWQHQAQRRCLHLRVSLPERLPTVLSDADMLNQVLTSLLDRFIRHLPLHSEIEMQVSVAGNQLKLQLQSILPPLDPHSPPCLTLADDVAEDWREPSFSEQFEALGNLLLLQPETGRLSLNLEVTKNLFQAIGGKLLIREKVDHGEVMTVFLPLERL
ncbi:MAG: sensor histidine kinase [Prochlorotrichaceae cyanobacterium]